jgi:WXG100 family type VII secretion target
MKRQPRRRTASTVADAFSVDPEALADAMHRMGEFMQHTESVVAEIDSLVTHLHQTWSGEAATAHAEAHRHWSQGEAKMREALKTLKTAGSTAHQNYTHAIAANVAMWS